MIGAEALRGLAVGDLLKVYTELGWGDVRDDFKKLNLELKRPPTSATVGVANTLTSAPGASSTQAPEVDVTAKRLNSSTTAVAAAAAERAELLMSAIHFEDENDGHGDSAGSKLGEERSTLDEFTVRPTMLQLQGSEPRCSQREDIGGGEVDTTIGLGSDPSPSHQAAGARGVEPFAGGFTSESPTTTENKAAIRTTATVAAASDPASSPPAAGCDIRQMRLDSYGRLIAITDSPTSGKRSRANSAVSFRDSGTPGVDRGTGAGPGSVSSRCVSNYLTFALTLVESSRLNDLLPTQLLH
eukprot:COSAG02_NODE_2689_length_8234_cov_3.337185_2_plen_299_part_00